MISNTVILFLRDFLPIFVLFCYLTILFGSKNLSSSYWFKSIFFGVMLTILFFVTAELISDLYEGAGLEIAHASLLVIAFNCLLLSHLLYPNPNNIGIGFTVFFFVGVGSFIALKGTEFLIFFSVYEQQEEQLFNIAIGCVVGLAICISFSALYRFFLQELFESKYKWIFSLGWYLFLAGQFSQITSFLSQVDIISVDAPIFDLSPFVKDSSEYGHILNALVGYESSPTKGFFTTYIIALLFPFMVQFLIKLLCSASSKKVTTNE